MHLNILHIRFLNMLQKQLSSSSVCRAKVFAGFSGRRNSIYTIIPLLKRKKKKIYRDLLFLFFFFFFFGYS